MGPYGYKVVIVFQSVPLGPVSPTHTEIMCQKEFHTAVYMEQMLAAEPDCTEVIKNVHTRRRIIIEIVADCGRKLGNGTSLGSHTVVRRASQGQSSTDDTHIYHWTHSEFLVPPAIRIYSAKNAEPQVARSTQVRHIGLPAKRKASGQRSIAAPAGLVEITDQFVLEGGTSVRIKQLKPKLILEIEIA